MNQEMKQHLTSVLLRFKETNMPFTEALARIEEVLKVKSVFFHISDQLDKLNAKAEGTSGLTFFVDYARGLIIKLTVYQPATEKMHNFTVIITPEMMKNEKRSDEELVKSLFAPIFEALSSVQTVASTCPILLDANGDVLHANS